MELFVLYRLAEGVGTIPMLKDEMKRIFSPTISFHDQNKVAEISGGFKIVSLGYPILGLKISKPNNTMGI